MGVEVEVKPMCLVPTYSYVIKGQDEMYGHVNSLFI